MGATLNFKYNNYKGWPRSQNQLIHQLKINWPKAQETHVNQGGGKRPATIIDCVISTFDGTNVISLILKYFYKISVSMICYGVLG